MSRAERLRNQPPSSPASPMSRCTGTTPSRLHRGRRHRHVAAAAAAHGYTAEQLDWHTPEGIVVKPVYTAADRAATAAEKGYPLNSFPGRATVRSRAVPDDVCQSAVDNSPVRGVLHGRRLERVLSAQPGRRARRGCPSRSTWRPTAGMTPTIRGCRATSEWPGWQSIPFSTCGSCSTASTCRRCRCR